MRSSCTAGFRKRLTCPAAEALVSYARAELAGEGRAAVARHLATCDFCGAEAQLLSRDVPPASAHPSAAPLPKHLRRLAEDLLARPSFNRARFAESLLEIERLTFTDA